MGRLSILVLALCVVSAHALSESLRGVQGGDSAALQAQLQQEQAKIAQLQAQNAKDRGTFLNFIKKASNIMGQDNKIFKGVDTATGNVKSDLQEGAAAPAPAAAAPAAAAPVETEHAVTGSGAGAASVEPPKDEVVEDKDVEDMPKNEYATKQTYPGTGSMAGSNKEETVFRYAAPPPGGAPPRQTQAELKDPTTVKKVEEADHDKYNLFEALPSPDEPIEPIVETIAREIPRASEGYSLNPPPPGPQAFAEPSPAPQVDVVHEQAGEALGGPPMGEIPLQANAPVAMNEDIAAVSAQPQA